MFDVLLSLCEEKALKNVLWCGGILPKEQRMFWKASSPFTCQSASASLPQSYSGQEDKGKREAVEWRSLMNHHGLYLATDEMWECFWSAFEATCCPGSYLSRTSVAQLAQMCYYEKTLLFTSNGCFWWCEKKTNSVVYYVIFSSSLILSH